MLPKITNLDVNEEIVPSLNFFMHIQEENINGKIDKLQAMEQVIYKILNTERYNYVIYSWNYGVEFKDLIGKQLTYAIPEIQRRITEALMQDDRIVSVGDFSIEETTKGSVLCYFKTNTIFGMVESTKEVQIA